MLTDKIAPEPQSFRILKLNVKRAPEKSTNMGSGGYTMVLYSIVHILWTKKYGLLNMVHIIWTL